MSEWFSKNLENAVVILRMPHEVIDGMNVYSGKDLAEIIDLIVTADNEIHDCKAEIARLREALKHISDGNLSPSIGFARFILQGDSVEVAHNKQCAIWDKNE